jgi:hypothetical protein
MEFTAQGGSTPEYRHSALLHTNPKRIKESILILVGALPSAPLTVGGGSGRGGGDGDQRKEEIGGSE